VQYFIAFKDQIFFEAILDDETLIKFSNIIAVNKAGEVIALEAPLGRVNSFFAPLEELIESDKMSGVLIDCIRKALQWAVPLRKPKWLENYHLPGEGSLLKKLETIDEEMRIKR
jgi:hypothetical protein